MRRWEVRDLGLGCLDIVQRLDNGMIEYFIADVWTDNADAQLLAAAPELLERLKQLIDLSDGRNPICLALAIKGAQELIDKLEGDV